LTKKRGGKGSDVELRRESAYDSNGTDLHTGLYVQWLRYGEIIVKPAVPLCKDETNYP
jgi:hypothetical protein